jgi:phosphoserine phosphatase
MKPILFVDLDESLIKIDILRTQLARSFAMSPWGTIKMFLRAKFRPERIKAVVTPQVDIDPATLPYNVHVLALIREAKGQGRTIVLATAAYHTIAQKVADYLGVFDAVLATTDTYNCKGMKKLLVMQEFAAGQPFDYVGDSRADLKIFEYTQTAYIVGDLKYSGNHHRIRC